MGSQNSYSAFEGMQMKKIVVCDIDGTIADSQWRTDRLVVLTREPTDEDYRRIWAPGAEHDKPITHVCQLVNTLHIFGYRIVFVTARHASMHRVTLEWLERVFTFRIELIMRSFGNFLPAAEIKLAKIRELGEIYCCIEDDSVVAEHFRAQGLFVLAVK